ncbi:MAG: type II toxin-antitoxin system RelE family toxin [Candidatus Heimdallarchaeaceae archaeon]
MFFVELSEKADKFLNKLDLNIRNLLIKGLKKLGDNPHPKDAKFICRHNDDKVFRHRIGDYRALYKVKENEKIVLISKIDKRPRIYHR